MTKLIDVLVELVKGILILFWDLCVLIYETVYPKPKKGYNDEFTNPKNHLSKKNTGFTIDGSVKGRISESTSNKHMAIIGPSGAGKTTIFIITNILLLLFQRISIVVNDISGEITERTSGLARRLGKTILIFDPENPECSDYFNPLAFANTSAQLNQVAHLLVQSSLEGGKQDSFWNESAEMLLYLIFSIQKELPSEFQNLYNSRYLLNQISTGSKEPTLLDILFSKTKNEALFQEYKALVYGSDTKLLSNVVSTAKASLRVLNDDNIAILTSKNTIDFGQLREGNTILYLKVPGLSADRLRPITSLLIETCFGTLMSRIPKQEVDAPVAFILDEVSSMVLSLESVLSTGRKYALWLMFALQHPQQLEMRYGRYQAKSILQNTHTKVYLAGQEQDVTQHIQSSLGFTDFIDEDNQQKRTMPLKTARQIAVMDKEQAMVFIGNDAFEIKLHPYYRQKEMQEQTSLPPVTRGDFEKPMLPQLITLNHLNNYEQNSKTKVAGTKKSVPTKKQDV